MPTLPSMRRVAGRRVRQRVVVPLPLPRTLVERSSTRRCRRRGSHFDLVFREFVAQRHCRA
jgi:hypothetical protein